MAIEKQGRIVWHDLFTKDLDLAKSFYADVAGWHYLTEYAEEFAWGGGEGEFVLALLADEAGAGLIDLAKDRPGDWIPYVEVEDVDSIADLAANLGGTIAKSPFEVRGVGRNCLLHDPLGVPVGISLSRHAFPVPTRQFGPELYLTEPGTFPEAFYRRLFGWKSEPDRGPQTETRFVTLAGATVAASAHCDRGATSPAQWIPSLKVGVLAEALARVKASGGEILDPCRAAAALESSALVGDPNGAAFLLFEQQV